MNSPGRVLRKLLHMTAVILNDKPVIVTPDSADPLESHIQHLGAQMMAAYARYEASGCFSDIGEAHAYRIQMQRAISQRSPAQVRALEAQRGLS